MYSIHQMAAAFIAPELAIEHPEAHELTAALSAVNVFYGTVVDPKLIAWVGLIGVAGKVYGPRVAAYSIRRTMEKAERQTAARSNPAAPFKPTVVSSPSPAPAPAPEKGTLRETFQSPDMVSLPTE